MRTLLDGGADAHKGEGHRQHKATFVAMKKGMPRMECMHSRDPGSTVFEALLELNIMSPFSTVIGTAEQTHRIVQGTTRTYGKT